MAAARWDDLSPTRFYLCNCVTRYRYVGHMGWRRTWPWPHAVWENDIPECTCTITDTAPADEQLLAALSDWHYEEIL